MSTHAKQIFVKEETNKTKTLMKRGDGDFFFPAYMFLGAYPVGVSKWENILRTEQQSFKGKTLLHEANKWKGDTTHTKFCLLWRSVSGISGNRKLQEKQV